MRQQEIPSKPGLTISLTLTFSIKKMTVILQKQEKSNIHWIL